MIIQSRIKPRDLNGALGRFFILSGAKIKNLHRSWTPSAGAPVFTRNGKYSTRGWTEWTQGFQFGCQLLQFDATGNEEFLKLGRENTIRFMPAHVSHIGVHDHGFNTISTYGNLRRLNREGKTIETADAAHLYDLAIMISGAVQAARWTTLKDGSGFIHSFNGPHSLFCDTIRSCRVLSLAHQLGHCLMGENDHKHSLLERMLHHAANTSRFNVYFGTGRDMYDAKGRVAHESLFNAKDGNYRCPSTQQGYSPFTTWTRGLAWTILGFAEQLEYVRSLKDKELQPFGGKRAIEKMFRDTAVATAEYYIAHSATDGIPYWDTGAPGLSHLPGVYAQPAQPDNLHEPVDSSAAAIAAQGMLRLGKALGIKSEGKRYWTAGLTIAQTLFAPPYLSENPRHQGLLLHSVYHRPNNWDYIPKGKKVPQGESSMWGDYHALELGVYLQREIADGEYLRFFD